MEHKILHEILSAQFASNNNLFSYTAKSYKGSLLQVNKDINKYLKAGLVQQIPFDLKPRNTRQQYFYFVTRDGAKTIDREEDFKQKITKPIDKAAHESMKIDIALSFIRNFPDYEFDFNYKADLGGIRPDILVKARNIHDHRESAFLVEIERKKEFSRIVREKILRYNKYIKDGLIKRNNLPGTTTILFVCSNLRYDIYLRPQQYPENKESLEFIYKQFDSLLEQVNVFPNKYFRFLPFPEFTDIAKPIWRMPNGIKVKLIQ